VFQVVLAFDALRKKNIIQTIGLCFFELAMLVYSSIEYEQIHNAVRTLSQEGVYEPTNWSLMEGLIIAIPCIIAVGLAVMSFLTYKLYSEFGWVVYKNIGADIFMKRRYTAYLVSFILSACPAQSP
jgi:heme/copper-type cytochrome/quinol oxidase subunit 2